MKNNIKPNDRLRKLLADDKKISAAMKRAIQEAIQKHKQAGNRIAVWENGRAVWLKPEEI
jgi:isoaspartyl peptidase/L-asparaginase-like protein (Ntn-hydrolase superfamily)